MQNNSLMESSTVWLSGRTLLYNHTATPLLISLMNKLRSTGHLPYTRTSILYDTKN